MPKRGANGALVTAVELERTPKVGDGARALGLRRLHLEANRAEEVEAGGAKQFSAELIIKLRPQLAKARMRPFLRRRQRCIVSILQASATGFAEAGCAASMTTGAAKSPPPLPHGWSGDLRSLSTEPAALLGEAKPGVGADACARTDAPSTRHARAPGSDSSRRADNGQAPYCTLR